MSISSRARSPSSASDAWGDLVARQGKLQAEIETALDRADACERLRDFEVAVAWLDRASALSGDLSASSRVQRARCTREFEGGVR
jgi:hypothetical protein